MKLKDLPIPDEGEDEFTDDDDTDETSEDLYEALRLLAETQTMVESIIIKGATRTVVRMPDNLPALAEEIAEFLDQWNFE